MKNEISLTAFRTHILNRIFLLKKLIIYKYFLNITGFFYSWDDLLREKVDANADLVKVWWTDYL